MSLLKNWGNYPSIHGKLYSKEFPWTQTELENHKTLIARGYGRSYGDASLGKEIANITNHSQLLSLNEKTGKIRCQAGLLLKDLLEIIIPKGWFVPVTPGTQYISIGGAVAADIHGKNHHKEGSFCDHVYELKIQLASSEVVTCSNTENQTLFHATCGGLGLTGIILEVEFQLKKIKSSLITQTTKHAKDLDEMMDIFKEKQNATYSVAWIDCLAKGDRQGQGVIFLGEHKEDGPLNVNSKKAINIPCNFPSYALNPYVIKTFNTLYKFSQKEGTKDISYLPYFYPLDSLTNWNRLYGKKGFVQYQCLLPLHSSKEGYKKILTEINEYKKSSFLAVLKLMGKGNNNYLSFPKEGFTLALDFPMSEDLLPFLNRLDKIVLDHEGHLYLVKDSRLEKQTFKKMFNTEKFDLAIKTWDKDHYFVSALSKRIGLKE